MPPHRYAISGENAFPELEWPYSTFPSALREQIGPLLPASDARDVVMRGSRMVRDAIAQAFGPHGAHISVSVASGQTRYYKKGVAVASSRQSDEPLEEIGIRHASGLAKQMRDSVGDGSKSAILLFQGMLERGSSAIKRNHPTHEVVRGMERAIEALVSAVRSQGRPANKDLLTQVARTAACGNNKIADLVVKAHMESPAFKC